MTKKKLLTTIFDVTEQLKGVNKFFAGNFAGRIISVRCFKKKNVELINIIIQV